MSEPSDPAAVAAQVPGQSQFGPQVDDFDERADALLEQLRGHPLADRLFQTASHVGDFSLIWHLAGTAQGLVSRRGPAAAVRLSAALGIESVSWAQQIVSVEDAPAREAGEVIEDDGETFNKIVEFLDNLKVI